MRLLVLSAALVQALVCCGDAQGPIKLQLTGQLQAPEHHSPIPVTVTSPTPQLNEGFGGAIAINEGWIVVGAPGYSITDPSTGGVVASAGAVYVFERTTLNLAHIIENPETQVSRREGARFGEAIAIDNELIVVGAPRAPSSFGSRAFGAAYLVNAATGLHEDSIYGGNVEFSNFGESVALNIVRNQVLVGAPGADPFKAGQAFLYQLRELSTGEHHAVLERAYENREGNSGAFDAFGERVALSASHMLISDPEYDLGGVPEAGAVYINGNFSRYLSGAPGIGEFFGRSIALDGDVALFGERAKIYFEYRGLLNIIGLDSGSSLSRVILAPTEHNSRFSRAVAIDGPVTVATDPAYSPNGTDADGAAWVFDTQSEGYELMLAKNPPDPTDGFGHSVVTLGETVVVGAPSQTVDSTQGAGAIHIFELVPTASHNDFETAEDQPIAITLQGYPTPVQSAAGQTPSYTVTQVPLHGALTGTPPELTYTPASDYVGVDTFRFEVVVDGKTSAPGTVEINMTPVNDPPLARDDEIILDTLDSVDIDVLVNDDDIDGDALTIESVTAPSAGNVVITAAQTVLFVPSEEGTFEMSYTISDGQLTAQAMLTMTVQLDGSTEPNEPGEPNTEPSEGSDQASNDEASLKSKGSCAQAPLGKIWLIILGFLAVLKSVRMRPRRRRETS